MEVPFAIDKMMDQFENSLSNKKMAKFQQDRVLDMNKKQKTLILFVAIVLIVMFLFPPFHLIIQGSEFNLGYGFIIDPPKYGGDILGSINVKLLMLQYLFACTIGIGIFFLLKTIKGKNEIYVKYATKNSKLPLSKATKEKASADLNSVVNNCRVNNLSSRTIKSDKGKSCSNKGRENERGQVARVSLLGYISSKIFNSEDGKTTSKQQAEAVVDTKELKPKKIWLYIVGFLVVGAYAGIFIPIFAGKNIINPASAGYSSMFITGLFFYILWKQRSRKGWQGALIGVLIGIIVFTLASFVEGLM